MPIRFSDTGQWLADFTATFLVVCPRCQRRASVIPLPGTEPKLFSPRRLVCAKCGHSKDWRGNHIRTGGPIDWYFWLPVWLQTSCCGKTLWAYNGEHLEYLEAYIRADLRERGTGGNETLISQLPRWMKEANNRAEVLRGIERLRQKLQ